MPVPKRVSALPNRGCPQPGPRRLTRRFHRLSAARGWVAYALRTRPPLSCPRKGNPVRLACIRPAASVHPEPGSNSSLYYCFSIYLLSHGLRIVSSSSRPPAPNLTAKTGVLCWPQAFNELSAKLPSASRPLPSFAGCKNTTFSINNKHFFHFFCIIIHKTMTIKKKKNDTNKKALPFCTHINI